MSLRKRLLDKSYQHGFEKCGDIEVMMCSDWHSKNRIQRDVIPVDTALKIFNDYLKEKK